MPSEPAPLTDRICTTPNCTKNVTVRDFCISCYYRNLRQSKIEPGVATKKWKHRLSEIDIDNKVANCSTCGPVKIRKRGGNSWRCAVAADARSKDYKKAYRQSKKDQLLDHCEICGTMENLCWDHNHKTGKFRGTLCSKCNTGIGHFQDSPERCLKAALYLSEKSNGRVEKDNGGEY